MWSGSHPDARDLKVSRRRGYAQYSPKSLDPDSLGFTLWLSGIRRV